MRAGWRLLGIEKCAVPVATEAGLRLLVIDERRPGALVGALGSVDPPDLEPTGATPTLAVLLPRSEGSDPTGNTNQPTRLMRDPPASRESPGHGWKRGAGPPNEPSNAMQLTNSTQTPPTIRGRHTPAQKRPTTQPRRDCICIHDHDAHHHTANPPLRHLPPPIRLLPADGDGDLRRLRPRRNRVAAAVRPDV